ncbi:competence protein ComEC [Fluviicoccus keumensis]|uniref:Competence protein ComEC n=1 Tax=Fluviicoccus keumensis TaxID=1435465 RepID=A0A4Q7Z4V0_9GAMM|nr:DNA internalization-related competence protein ComEC/Rec2 [Fluviicoccus keumensis]RZU45024.1 competence protein ComEC [Fluviicoccus keumensis]
MSNPGWAAFAAGISLLLLLPFLPDESYVALAGLALLVLSLRLRFLRVPAWLLLGLAWGVWHARAYLEDRIPQAWEGRPLTVEARIVGLPHPSAHGRLGIRVLPLRTSSQGLPLPGARYWELTGEPADFRPGDVWVLTVSLKRPHGSVSPNAFDLEEWLMSEGVTATGTIRQARLLKAGNWSMDRWRLSIRERFQPLIIDKPDAAIALSLLTGDRAEIDDDRLRLYQSAGISHLLAISGPHVLLFAVAVAGALRWLAGRRPVLFRRMPFQRWQWPVLLAAAIAYGCLAGASLPTMRTLVMLALCVLARMSGREADAWSVLWRALALVLFWQPLSVHAAGFWLSFGAVALIMLWGGIRRRGSALMQAAGLQLYLFLAMLPLGLLFFGQVSLIAPLANAVAIPLISVLVVPLLLAGLMVGYGWHHAGMACWYWAGCLLERLDDLLAWMTTHGAGLFYWRPGPVALISLSLALAMFLAPRRLALRAPATFLLLPVVFARPLPERGELRMAVLDVGQGLSVVLHTRSHSLLYDTGPGPLAGRDVVLSYLYGAGIRRLDRLVLSHNDLDHTGGAAEVIRGIPASEVVYSALPEAYRPGLESRQQFCRQGQHWDWDGIRFRVVSPGPSLAGAADNNRSCVLHVQGEGFSILLTGDIETPAEQALLGSGEDLRADVLVLPHHGSNTSSSPAFLQAVQPRLGIVSAGYRNRFGHPAARIVERYRSARIPLDSTILSGTLDYRFAPGGHIDRESWRTGRHYWRNSS